MSKSKRKKRRRNRKQKPNQSDSIAELFQNERFADIVELFVASGQANLQRSDLRMIGKSYARIEQYKEAANCFLSIEKPSSSDFLMAAKSFMAAGLWKEAEKNAAESIQLEPTASGYLSLAKAMERDDYGSSCDRSYQIDLLKQAKSFKMQIQKHTSGYTNSISMNGNFRNLLLLIQQNMGCLTLDWNAILNVWKFVAVAFAVFCLVSLT